MPKYFKLTSALALAMLALFVTTGCGQQAMDDQTIRTAPGAGGSQKPVPSQGQVSADTLRLASISANSFSEFLIVNKNITIPVAPYQPSATDPSQASLFFILIFDGRFFQGNLDLETGHTVAEADIQTLATNAVCSGWWTLLKRSGDTKNYQGNYLVLSGATPLPLKRIFDSSTDSVKAVFSHSDTYFGGDDLIVQCKSKRAQDLTVADLRTLLGPSTQVTN